jgi:hypothetical protein
MIRSEKKQRDKHFSFLVFLWISAFLFLFAGILAFPEAIYADYSSLKKIIAAYNIDVYKDSLSDGSYRGEEGILRMSPEIGGSYGLKVFINEDYQDAKDLFKKANKHFENAARALITRKRERSPDEHITNAAEAALLHKRTLECAKAHLRRYKSKLSKHNDERLKKAVCLDLMEALLDEAFLKTSYNLRNALAYFYNKCQGINIDNDHLNVQNVKFVNFVFREFMKRASSREKSQFDLDTNNRNNGAIEKSEWTYLLGRKASRYSKSFDYLYNWQSENGFYDDVLLFLSLIRQESRFNPRSVSRIGAVGLTQIMPKTAKELGMEKIYMPLYLDEAEALLAEERRQRRDAMGLILEITEENKLDVARQARTLMQQSRDKNRKRNQIYLRYKREVLKTNWDERLHPQKAIEYGFKYFKMMLKAHNGDMSLALASYNSGPHRVEQYQGVPPYRETVRFRNNILRYYREYLQRLENRRAKLKKDG